MAFCNSARLLLLLVRMHGKKYALWEIDRVGTDAFVRPARRSRACGEAAVSCEPRATSRTGKGTSSGRANAASGGKQCEHLRCIESLPFFCCFLTPGTHLVFPGPIPSGEWILPPCGQPTFTSWDLAGLTGIFILGSDSLSACFFCSRWCWRGSSGAFRQNLWLSCAALRGRSPFALPPSLF